MMPIVGESLEGMAFLFARLQVRYRVKSDILIFTGKLGKNGPAVSEVIFYRIDEEMMNIYEESRDGRRRKKLKSKCDLRRTIIAA